MRPESDEQLNSILEVLKSNPNLKIELVGHTDNVGDSRQNVYLSKFRAKVVGSYLYNQGISDTRISTKGMGDEFPVIQNDTEENKSQNRRVELIVVEN
jgi:outer membrane protein OmpA-like peptidoglycan-associated protein